MSKVMITGANGFLATHIIPAFEQNHEVIKVDKRLNFDVFDLNFRDLMGVDFVIHLAWRTNIPDCSRHPEESTYDNINMTLHLLELCKEAGNIRFFFPSTASLYGNNPTPWSEDMTPHPQEHYSWQKLACEHLCGLYENTVIARFFQVFGEHQREDTALAAFLRFKKAGMPITLTETMAQSKFKSGQRDFIYAGDLAEAVVMLTESNEGGIFNIASGKVHTMEVIAKALESEVKWIPKRPYETERHEGNIDKLKALGWQPRTNVIEWLKHAV